MLKSKIETYLAGTKNQYYILKLFNDDGSIKKVHTSKNLNYLRAIKKEKEEYQNETRTR